MRKKTSHLQDPCFNPVLCLYGVFHVSLMFMWVLSRFLHTPQILIVVNVLSMEPFDLHGTLGVAELKISSNNNNLIRVIIIITLFVYSSSFLITQGQEVKTFHI